jgi:hypothetical protein
MRYFFTVLCISLIFFISMSEVIAQVSSLSYVSDHDPAVKYSVSELGIIGEFSIFDAGSWCPTGTFPDLPSATYFQSSAWLGDTLYVQTPTATGTVSNTIIRYTMGGVWSTGIALPVALIGGKLVSCAGKLYYIGGSDVAINTTTPLNTVYEYTPANGSWVTKAPMPVGLSAHGAVSWGDSVIFVIGGPYSGSGTNLNVYYYRVATNSWGTITNSLPAGQGRRTFALGLSGNKIIMSGGFNTAFLKSTWVGTIGSNATQLSWAAAPDVPTIYTGLSRPGGTAIDDYFFIVCGERGGPGGYYDTTHVYKISTNSWTDIINNIPFKMSNIFNAVAAKIFNDSIKIFVPGGFGSLTGGLPGASTNLFNVVGCGNLIIIPVELISFTSLVNESDVRLSWSTSTETNNSGFQVERSTEGSDYVTLGFIAGHGTTTEIQNYSFIDQNVYAGKYAYRLKQIDFNGDVEYTNTIEVEVLGIKEFKLDQNYPNPFNPSTRINFSLASDSKVSVKIINLLGQEVATLVNGHMTSGSQTVSFDASSLNSGVYFYRIDATGIDGTKFSSVKKMVFTK